MYDLGCMLVESRPFVVLDGLPGLYWLKYDSATACGLLLYLCSYKLDGSVTTGIDARFNTKLVIWVFKTKVLFYKIRLITYSYNIGVLKSKF